MQKLVFRLKFREFRGVREEGTEHTKLYSRIFTGSGLTWHQKDHFLTFDGKHFITEWSQNFPYGPRPREQKLLFSIFTYPIIHLKNRKNENQDLGFPNKIHGCSLKLQKRQIFFDKYARVSASPLKSMNFPQNEQNNQIFFWKYHHFCFLHFS